MGYSPWGHKESDTTERLHFNVRCAVAFSSFLGILPEFLLFPS